MGGELGELAGSAATTIVTLLATDAWGQVKEKIGALWHQFRPEQADDIETALDNGHLEVQNADATVALAITRDWESRLLRLLAVNSAVAADLARAVTELNQIQAGKPEHSSIRLNVTATDHSTAIVGGRDVTIGKLPPVRGA